MDHGTPPVAVSPLALIGIRLTRSGDPPHSRVAVMSVGAGAADLPSITANNRRAPLVGRADELGALAAVVRRVRQGGQIAVVEGEAGIGKSRLVGAALDAAGAAGTTVLSTAADELDVHRPFAAILGLSPAGANARWRDPIRDAMGLAGPGLDVEGERRFRVAEAVLELLERECMRGPVVVAVEDVHWADPATIGVLAQLARALGTLPAAMIVSARPQPRRRALERLLALLETQRALTVRLGPLDDGACAQLVASLVGATPGPRLLRQTRGAAGNPLFVSELIEALAADGVIEDADGMAEVSLSQETPSLPMTILHRLSFLDPETLELLGLASVLGTSFTAADLALLAGRPVAQLVGTLQTARRAEVITAAGDRLAFRHDLVRGALYEDMPLSVRRALHAEFARSLARAGEPPERATEHLLRAASRGDERSLAALVSAGRALTSHAPSAAVDLLHSAIELSADPTTARSAVLPDLAQALVSAGRLADGEEACREAIARGLDADTETRLRLQLVMLLTRRPRTESAMREAEAGLAAGATTQEGRGRLRGWLAMTRVFEGDVDAAVADAEAVLGSTQDEFARALALDALALAASVRGRFAEAAELIADSASKVEAIGSREAYDSCPHMILGLQLARLDRLDEAAAAIQRGRRASEALGMIDTLASFHYQLALVDWLRGRLEDALAELATHRDYAEQTGAGWSVPADSLRSLIALHRGDVLVAERHVAAAEQAVADGAPGTRSTSWCSPAGVCWRRGATPRPRWMRWPRPSRRRSRRARPPTSRCWRPSWHAWRHTPAGPSAAPTQCPPSRRSPRSIPERSAFAPRRCRLGAG